MDITKYKLGEGELLYIPHWADDPDALYEEAKRLSFTPEVANQYGKPVVIKKRKTVDYGPDYGYGKFAKRSIPWEPLALAIKQRLETQLGRTLQQCACNRYLDPEGYISAHVDKVATIDGLKLAPNLIISLSLGATRIMALRPIHQGHEGDTRNQMVTMSEVRKEKDAIVLELEPGSLVMFNGPLNHSWKHAIPMDENKAAGERISLTYREF